MSYKGRSSWKGLNYLIFNKNFLNKKFIYNINVIKLVTKNYVISEFDVNKKYYIFNGKYFIKIFLSKLACGFKFGQFILTKKIGKQIHLQVKKVRKKQKPKRK